MQLRQSFIKTCVISKEPMPKRDRHWVDVPDSKEILTDFCNKQRKKY